MQHLRRPRLGKRGPDRSPRARRRSASASTGPREPGRLVVLGDGDEPTPAGDGGMVAGCPTTSACEGEPSSRLHFDWQF